MNIFADLPISPKSPVSESEGILQEISVHPVHLTEDNEGNLPPSALVSFCSYQEGASLLGEERQELGNLTLCDKFRPTILEGQLCYSLETAKYATKPTKAGKRNGFFLLLDPNPYPSRDVDAERNGQDSFKVYIHTLAQHTAFGPGAYKMHTLKSMAVKKSFEQLPDHQKGCQVHNREGCQTKQFLDRVQSICGCVPWPLATDSSNKEVIHPAQIICGR